MKKLLKYGKNAEKICLTKQKSGGKPSKEILAMSRQMFLQATLLYDCLIFNFRPTGGPYLDFFSQISKLKN